MPRGKSTCEKCHESFNSAHIAKHRLACITASLRKWCPREDQQSRGGSREQRKFLKLTGDKQMRPIPEVDALDVAFPTKALQFMPSMKDIPDEFKNDSNKWVKVVHDWFFSGIKKSKWTPKPGVQTKKALAAVSACIGDFAPSHEHKTAGCAFLLSEWFEDVTYEKGGIS